MYRIVQVVERNGQIHQIPMTAQQANFYHRLAELKAVTQPTITFHDVVIEHRAQVRQARPKNER
jgi:hypothetical protein